MYVKAPTSSPGREADRLKSQQFGKPFIFLSSFTQEFGGWLPDGTVDQNTLRYRASQLGKESRRNVWVAELAMPDLNLTNKEPLDVVDTLWQSVRNCEVFVCLLGGSRQHSRAYGTKVSIAERPSAVSYFEAEVALALMLGKPIEVLVAEGFDPGPRLAAFVGLLRRAVPARHWQERKSETEILRGIKLILRAHAFAHSTLPSWMPVWRNRTAGLLLSLMYHSRASPDRKPPGHREVFFLDGIYESGSRKPDKELVDDLLQKASAASITEPKLARLFIALRELGAAPPSRECPTEFLLLWDRTLGAWATTSAWYGLNGPVYIGRLSALYTLAQVRQLLLLRSENTLLPERVAHPVGLASALYSTAKLMPSRAERNSVFEDGFEHLSQSIRLQGGL